MPALSDSILGMLTGNPTPLQFPHKKNNKQTTHNVMAPTNSIRFEIAQYYDMPCSFATGPRVKPGISVKPRVKPGISVKPWAKHGILACI